jgi:peptidoglycan/LPS O-acetylase OafA/YrhL
LQYRPEIDGLRAVSVLAVIFSHAHITGFSGGYIGVDVFFVISGFLISSIIIADKGRNDFSLVRFYERRAKRILPALFFVLLASFPIAWFVMLPHAFERYSNSLIAAALSVSNFYFLVTANYFSPISAEMPLVHTWSLGVEEQFYLLLPMMFLFCRGDRLRILVSAAILIFSFFLCIFAASHFPSENYYLLPTRAWELLSGVLLAFYISRNTVAPNAAMAWLGMLMVVIGIFVFNDATPYPSHYTVVPVLGTILVLAFASSNSGCGWVLSNKCLVWLGKISFSAYLWHQPAFAFARLMGSYVDTLIIQLSLVSLSLILAALTYRFVEIKFRYAGMNIKRFALGIVISCLAIVSLGAWGAIGNGLAFRMPNAVMAFYQTVSWHAGCLYLVEDGEFEVPRPNCVFGGGTGPKIALWGDSVGASVSQEIVQNMSAIDAQFVQLSTRTCAPVLGVKLSIKKESFHCDAINQATIDYLIANKFDAVLMVAAWAEFIQFREHLDAGNEVISNRDFDNVFREKFLNTVDILLANDIKIFFIDPLPFLQVSALNKMVSRIYFGETDADVWVPRTDFENNIVRAETLMALPPNANIFRVSPRGVFCEGRDDRCYLARRGTLYVADFTHYTSAGARLIAQPLMAEIKRTFAFAR